MRAYLNAMRRYARFSGRTSQEEFWRAQIVFLPLALLAFGVFGLPFPVNGSGMGSRSVWPLLFFVLIVLPHVVPWAALMVRRLHDMDFRGWWALIGLVPLVFVVPLGLIVLMIWACLHGTPGPNRFGPDPLGRDTPARQTVSPASRAIPTSSSAPPASRDVIAEIERLAQLRAAGSLSETEFEVMKARAMGRTGPA